MPRPGATSGWRGSSRMLARHGLRVAALENISPNFWSDILLDGPKRAADRGAEAARPGRGACRHSGHRLQLLDRRRLGLAAPAAGARRRHDDRLRPRRRSIPKSRSPTAWSGTCAIAPGGPARRRSRSARRLWDRLAWFLAELVPVAEEAGVRLAAHPDDPPVERLRGTARLVNEPREVRPAAGAVAEPGERARVLHRLAGRDGRGRHLGDDAPLRAHGRDRLRPLPQRDAARCRATSRRSSTTATSTWPRSCGCCARKGLTACWCPTTCRSSTARRRGTPAMPIPSAT